MEELTPSERQTLIGIMNAEYARLTERLERPVGAPDEVTGADREAYKLRLANTIMVAHKLGLHR